MTSPDVHGPIDFVLLEFPRDRLSGDAAGAMEPDTVAALIVYENTWAIPFVAAVRDRGERPGSAASGRTVRRSRRAARG